MKIQTNTAAMFALNYMSVNEKHSQKSIERLSSGFRINSAGDDAAGLAIANKLRSDGKGLGQAQKNVAQASSMLQVMDGATQTVSTILDRMKELATQANSANIGNQSGALQKEFTSLSSEIDRIAATTNYQGTNLLDGTFGSGVDMTTSATSAAYKTGGALAGALSLPAGTSGLPAGAAGIKVSYAAGTAGTAASGNTAAVPPTNGTITFTYVDSTGTALTGAGATTTASVTGPATGSTLGAAQTITSGDGKISLALPSGFDFTSTSVLGSSSSPTSINFQKTGSFQVSSSGSYGFGGHDQIQVASVNVSSAGLGLTGLDLTTQTGAASALTAIDAATNTVSTALGSIGAAESRLDFASTNVATALQNTQAAESTIRDTDMAAEMTDYTKSNILQQAAQSMLSQANQSTQGVLKLLQ